MLTGSFVRSPLRRTAQTAVRSVYQWSIETERMRICRFMPRNDMRTKVFSCCGDRNGTAHTLPKAGDIIDEGLIGRLLESTKIRAKDEAAVKDILQKATDRALLKEGDVPGSEYVQGLTLDETATLLNVDSNNAKLMQMLFNTALGIKERIYGNRIVLFAPLYVCPNAPFWPRMREKSAF